MLHLSVPKEEIQKMCRKHNVEFLGVFGSVARGDDRPDSDMDVLVRFAPDSKASLLDLVRMEFDLRDMMGRRVDLVTEGFLSPYIKERVIHDVEPIYGHL